MIYLEKFKLPTIDKEEKIISKRAAINGGTYGYVDNTYPCGIFSNKEFYNITFKDVTIFYGGNGSGKSTLLNVIANKMHLKRVSPFNSSEMFDLYTGACRYSFGWDMEGYQYNIPHESRIITSDDIFDYMLTVRDNNAEISQGKEAARDMHNSLKYGATIKMNGLEDYEEYRLQVQARKKSVSRRQFIRELAGDEVKLNSNGETALLYFCEKIKNNTLCCLDEPENSLSPKMQLELVKMLENLSHYCGCQLIIATHSPFLLALNNAKIYNLDETPVEICNWWELENTKLYYNFFQKHSNLFN